MLPASDCSWRDWQIPLSCREVTLADALKSAEHMAADQNDVPLIIRLIENPKFDIPGVNIFDGAVNLYDHDCIHALLGRGLLSKDEAFVIGFTMGSTNRVSTTQQKLFELAARYLYPGPYKFSDEDIHVFKDAVSLGFVSDCDPLDRVDYRSRVDQTLGEVRAELGIETDLLEAYYRIEQRRYPDAKTSLRLL
ncbi:MAG: hypothetical protein K0U93_03465 [Gammaproteobacteria bacterium]|nr:hypothetical protein [Gammaproteobacteria bacterium]